MRTKRWRVLFGIVALAALFGAVPAHAEITGPGTRYQPVADCSAGVGPIALPGTLGPPPALPVLVYASEIGTSTTPCASTHTNLWVISELYLLPTDDAPNSGVLVARTVAQCQLCNRAVALSTFLLAPGLYRITGHVTVDDSGTLTTATIVGPPFIYTGLSVLAPPSTP